MIQVPRATLEAMKSYRQFCPIARGSEIIAERWTPVIMRNILEGSRTFNELAAGAPGLSRSLLTKRLAELTRWGLITTRPKAEGQGSFYEPTPAGQAAAGVLGAIASWAEEWVAVRPEHSDPGLVLAAWCHKSLRRDLLPARRVVVRFDFRQRGHRIRSWLLAHGGDAEICNFDPGFGDDLHVVINDAVAFTRWHLGQVSWAYLLRSQAVTLTGPAALRRALPTWNGAPEQAAQHSGRPRRTLA